MLHRPVLDVSIEKKNAETASTLTTAAHFGRFNSFFFKYMYTYKYIM